MSKRKRPTKKSAVRSTTDGPGALNATNRNAALDALRGLAVVLMIIDHVAGILFSINIEPGSIRFWTRLSMPLFAQLMGYFLDSRRVLNVKRNRQIAIAFLLVNATFFPFYREFDILGSLLIALALFVLFRSYFCLLYFLTWLHPWDPTALLLDYSATIVVGSVAQGMILRQYGWKLAMVTSLLQATAVWVGPGDQVFELYVLFFSLPACLLIAGASQCPKWQLPGLTLLGRFPWALLLQTAYGSHHRLLPGLTLLGRYPLTVYVIQYYTIFAVHLLVKHSG